MRVVSTAITKGLLVAVVVLLVLGALLTSSFLQSQAEIKQLQGTIQSYQSNASRLQNQISDLQSQILSLYAQIQMLVNETVSVNATAPSNFTSNATGETNSTVPSNSTEGGGSSLFRTPEPGRTPFVHPLYLTNDAACSGMQGDLPCFGGNEATAYVFDCAEAAASSDGCTVRVTSTLDPTNSYLVTIWFPYVTQTGEPWWANCMFEFTGEYGQPYGYCLMTNSTAFILAYPGPPPV